MIARGRIVASLRITSSMWSCRPPTHLGVPTSVHQKCRFLSGDPGPMVYLAPRVYILNGMTIGSVVSAGFTVVTNT